MQQIQKMGPLGQVMSMIPGMGNIAGEAQAAVDRGDLKRTEAIIRAMTPRRASRPDRPQQLAPPADRRRLRDDLPDVNRLVKQFLEMQKLMKQLSGGGRRGALGALAGRR